MKILVAAARAPWPPHRGDQLRLRQIVEALAAEHEVTLLAPAAAGEPPAPRVRREVYRERPAALAAAAAAARGMLRGWPLQSLPFHQPELGRRLRELVPRHDRVVLLLARLLPHLEDAAGLPLAVDFIDCLSLNAASRAGVDRPWLRPLLQREATRLRGAEGHLLAAAQTALVVCDRDRQAMAAAHPELSTRLGVVPIAVPVTERADAGGATATPGAILLTGNLGYFPNRDAVRWFVREVWPRLRRERRDARLVIAGDRPPRALARLVGASGAVLVPRPPDMRALLRTAAVAVAPLRCGSGVPIKVLDAWAAGAPVVASPFATAGIAGERERDLLVATTPADWVTQIGRALDDAPLRAQLAEGGRARLAELLPERVYPALRRLLTAGR